MAKPRIFVTAKIGDRLININGREAQALLALVEHGPRGITSLDMGRAGWAIRLGAYIHDLRHKFGVPIETTREPHDGGQHGRYTLTGPVQIISQSASLIEEAA
ncbi:MAG: hypothetical protein AB7V46_09940 [Thermomicrobiales bacterium]